MALNVPNTYSSTFVPTVLPDPSVSRQFDAFPHIYTQEAFRNYSPEELRLSDYSAIALDHIREHALPQLLSDLGSLQVKVEQLTQEKEAMEGILKRSAIMENARSEAPKKKNDELSEAVKKVEEDGRRQALKEILFIY
jgi:hypothetical protein